MRAMIFDGFGDGLKIGGREETSYSRISAEEGSGDDFVVSGVDMMAEIMESGDGINNIRIERDGHARGFLRVADQRLGSELETAADDVIDVVDLMSPFILSILG